MAYTAMVTLSQLLEKILEQNEYPLHPPLEKEKLVSLNGNVTNMLTFLENHSPNQAVHRLENRIISAAYQAEDIIESQISSRHISESNTRTRCGRSLRKTIKEIAFIMKQLVEIQNRGEIFPSLDRSDSGSFSALALNGTNVMVGTDEDLRLINSQIYHGSSEFKVIATVGMGGIGKTTLARRIYEDSMRTTRFDRRAWVVVSQGYSYSQILLGVLQSITNPNPEEDLSMNSDSRLRELIHKELFRRRYLIVLDDVWSAGSWDELNRIFPKNTNGSRLLLTSRLSNVAFASSPPHTMNLLDEEQSWRLLKERVFGEGPCPYLLERIGRRIARECWGLPLTIVVVAGLLKENTRQEYWDSISRNIGSREPTISLHCSKVLSLSYDHLPLYLKPCFLYVTAFPEGSEIKVDGLVKLWVAEGFIRPNGLEGLEKVAEECLNDLLGRSLLLVSSRRYGRIKTVRIHDILRDFGILQAQKERFLHCDNEGTEIHDNHRRISIDTDQGLWFIVDAPDPIIRSLMIFSSAKSNRRFPVRNFRLLKILVAEVPLFGKLKNLIHLKYLVLRYNGFEIFDSMWKLQNLQTLIIIPGKDYYGVRDERRIPLEFWKMPSLKHIIVPEGLYFDQPSEYETIRRTNLETFTVTANFEMTTQNINMIGNIKKLGLYYFVENQKDWKSPLFSNLGHLQSLQEFKIIIAFHILIPRNSETPPVKLVFPPCLKKVSLTGVGCPDWENINAMLGSLPNLEVLKLSGFVTRDLDWNTVEGNFTRLKHLKFSGTLSLRIWEVEDGSHFPSLETLTLVCQLGLREIPRTIGDIDTLKRIELIGGRSSLVDSAMLIQADQLAMANHELQVILR